MSDIDKSKLARTGDEFRTLVQSNADWLIRSHDDLDTHRKNSGSPLSRLDEAAYREFAESLHFHDGGIGGGYYKPLMSLPLSDIFAIFNSFGASDELARSMQEARCEGGECVWDFWYFCSSLCIRVQEPHTM